MRFMNMIRLKVTTSQIAIEVLHRILTYVGNELNSETAIQPNWVDPATV